MFPIFREGMWSFSIHGIIKNSSSTKALVMPLPLLCRSSGSIKVAHISSTNYLPVMCSEVVDSLGEGLILLQVCLW